LEITPGKITSGKSYEIYVFFLYWLDDRSI